MQKKIDAYGFLSNENRKPITNPSKRYVLQIALHNQTELSKVRAELKNYGDIKVEIDQVQIPKNNRKLMKVQEGHREPAEPIKKVKREENYLFSTIQKINAGTDIENIIQDLPNEDQSLLYTNIQSLISYQMLLNSKRDYKNMMDHISKNFELQNNLLNQLIQAENLNEEAITKLEEPQEVKKIASDSVQKGQKKPEPAQPAKNTQVYIINTILINLNR